ncbi:MAG: hypothetical protein ACI9XP_000242 [Lentimonas sp.]|jgi:hypothetical protein
MIITSEKAIVSSSVGEIITYLSDAKNLWDLMPQDKVSDWTADENQCSFKVQGAIVITLIEDGKEENKLFLKSGEKSPFPFRLTIHINQLETKTEGFIEFDGEVNMFLKMMVEKPLTALFNFMTQKLQEKFV